MVQRADDGEGGTRDMKICYAGAEAGYRGTAIGGYLLVVRL